MQVVQTIGAAITLNCKEETVFLITPNAIYQLASLPHMNGSKLSALSIAKVIKPRLPEEYTIAIETPLCETTIGNEASESVYVEGFRFVRVSKIIHITPIAPPSGPADQREKAEEIKTAKSGTKK